MPAYLPSTDDWFVPFRRRVRFERAPAARRWVAALVASIAFHLALIVGLAVALRDRAVLRTSDEVSMQVRLIAPTIVDAESPLQTTAQAEIRSRAPTRPLPTHRASTVPKTPAKVEIATLNSPPPLQPIVLFEPDGRVRLPKTLDGPTPSEPPTHPLVSAEGEALLTHRTPMVYAPTRLERRWVPRDETLFDSFVREATVSGGYRTASGFEVHCAWVLIIGGCGWGRTAPSIDEMRRDRVDPPLPHGDASEQKRLAMTQSRVSPTFPRPRL